MQSQSARRDFSRLLKLLAGILHDIMLSLPYLCCHGSLSSGHNSTLPLSIIVLHALRIVTSHGWWLHALVCSLSCFVLS